MVGVALTPAATAWLVSVRTAFWAAPVATQACQRSDVQTGRRGDRRQPGRGVGALVLPGLIGEGPVLVRPVATLVSSATRTGPRFHRLVVRRRALGTLERGVMMDDPKHAGGHVLGHQSRLDRLGELAADRALEVGPDLERDRRVRLADGPSIGQRDRRRCQRADERARRIRRRPLRPGAGSSPARTTTPTPPTIAVIRRSGDRPARDAERRRVELAASRSAARRARRVCGVLVALLTVGSWQFRCVDGCRRVATCQQHLRPTCPTTWAVRHDLAG